MQVLWAKQPLLRMLPGQEIQQLNVSSAQEWNLSQLKWIFQMLHSVWHADSSCDRLITVFLIWVKGKNHRSHFLENNCRTRHLLSKDMKCVEKLTKKTNAVGNSKYISDR